MTGVIRKVKGKECYFLDGKRVSKAVFDRELEAARPKTGRARPIARPRGMKRGYPIVSESMAVTTKAIKAAQALDAKLGVPTEYTGRGRPILRDAAHRRAFLKAHGLVDRNSFTGH